MKKTLLIVSAFMAFTSAKAQNLFSFGFGGTTADLTTAGWVRTNQSTSASTTSLWSIASYTEVTVDNVTTFATPFQNQTYAAGDTCPIPNGQDGTPNTFALVNYTSTTSTAASGATISNWLITPTINVANGDVVTFYTRKGTSGTTDYPDRLELRMSSAATTVQPTGGPTGVGSFTTLCTSVNPALAAGFVYPKVWIQYTYTVSGLSGPTAVKFAFRYYVTNAGTNGSNSDIIGIDTFSVDRPLSTSDFFSQNFAISPNPVKSSFNLTVKNGASVQNVKVIDMNGRVVNTTDVSDLNDIQLNLADLSTGVYFVKVQSDLGIGTSKIIKQ
ncbi:MAG TPA: choice-of-anchor J domain-containing protein [Flavobacterium sp.]|uniref:T9SS-dependent choice-of-anchor J family protein n=1 Tax=Flavobacterium sp. TaxID=239 RepID=UPI002CBADDA4|nr:choice-of-anchor J domain-containing protein [Flavobacterium sp.]HNP32140.1 choice-of-anchor J domain-containing protein [Flavobacterium sp.]